jgi:hypothetical protein
MTTDPGTLDDSLSLDDVLIKVEISDYCILRPKGKS